MHMQKGPSRSHLLGWQAGLHPLPQREEEVVFFFGAPRQGLISLEILAGLISLVWGPTKRRKKTRGYLHRVS